MDCTFPSRVCGLAASHGGKKEESSHFTAKLCAHAFHWHLVTPRGSPPDMQIGCLGRMPNRRLTPRPVFRIGGCCPLITRSTQHAAHTAARNGRGTNAKERKTEAASKGWTDPASQYSTNKAGCTSSSSRLVRLVSDVSVSFPRRNSPSRRPRRGLMKRQIDRAAMSKSPLIIPRCLFSSNQLRLSLASAGQPLSQTGLLFTGLCCHELLSLQVSQASKQKASFFISQAHLSATGHAMLCRHKRFFFLLSFMLMTSLQVTSSCFT